MQKQLAAGLAAVAMAVAGSAAAQMRGEAHTYIGASGGEAKFRTECSSLFTCDRKDTAWKVYGGSNMGDVLGLELGYTDFGKIRVSGGETDAWGASVSLTAGVPIGDRFSVFAKGGGVYGRTDVKASASSLVDSGHKTGWGTTYGVGAALGLTRAVQLRVDWDRYKLDFAGGRRDIDLLSAGVQMRF